MAKELMEIGGFITEGAEIVNHDASLSGNGTVDSPLGVVPGYNETVLFQYTGSTAITSGTLSEPATNFDMLRVCFREAATGNDYQGGNLVSFIDVNECKNGNNLNSATCCISFHNLFQNAAIGLRYGFLKLTSPTTFTAFRGERPYASTASGTSIGNMWPTKVVGINRKAQ